MFFKNHAFLVGYQAFVLEEKDQRTGASSDARMNTPIRYFAYSSSDKELANM